MASTLDIANSALAKLGAIPLIDINDGSKEGDLCTARFPMCRDYVLREHPWKCAIKRMALSPLLTPPLADPNAMTQYQYAYQMPSDFIRYAKDDDDRLQFQVEGNTLLTNDTNVVLRYIWRVNDTTIFDSHLAECIAWYLAQDIALSLTQNTLIADRMTKQYVGFLKRATFIDASTNRAPKTQDDYFVNARLQANRL